MITYEQWNKAIIKHIFANCEPGEIVFLNTTSETLSDIDEQEGFNVDAVDSLKEAVRNKVISSNRVCLTRIDPDIFFNRTPENEPTQVAFLALSVLAASMMERSDDVSNNNYYVRLNQLLFDEMIENCPKGIKLLDIKRFWTQLQTWALEQHEVELYLTEGPANQKYVWYPKSQCLIRMHDRRTVYQFFRYQGFTPVSNIPDNQLERDFRMWLGSRDGSARIYQFFTNSSYKALILRQVRLLLENWDGEIPPKPVVGQIQSPSKIHVELHFNQFSNLEIRYWFQRRGRDDIGCKTNLFGIENLQTYTSEKWFRPFPDNSDTFWNLSSQLQLQTDEINPMVYTLYCSDIWVFRVDQERDEGWISQQNMQLYQDHLIVFKERYIRRIKNCLSQTCEHEIDSPNAIYVNGEENGWLYLKATPTKLESFDDPDLWILSVKSSEQISLNGGLSVKDQNGHRSYLNICLPSIFVPELGFSSEESLRIGERRFPVNEDRLVSLEGILDVGIHQISYGSKTRELRIIASERSLDHQEKMLIAKLDTAKKTIPTYSEKETDEISEDSSVWISGARFFGIDILNTTWNNVCKPPILKKDEKQSLEKPAEIISSVVKLAIDLKKKKNPVPKWFKKTIQDIDNNVAMRTLVEKKLRKHKQTALSYTELRKYISR